MGRMGRRRLGGPGEQGTPGLSKGRVWRWAGGVGSPERASSQLTGMGILDTAAMGGDPQGMHRGGPRWVVTEQSKMT